MEATRDASKSTSEVTHISLFAGKCLAHIAWWLHRTKVHPSYLSLMAQDQYFDISKAKQILRWEPNFSSEDAIRDTIDFLKREYL
jgi:nucleoside-diphosphate-sugar epimerase